MTGASVLLLCTMLQCISENLYWPGCLFTNLAFKIEISLELHKQLAVASGGKRGLV